MTMTPGQIYRKVMASSARRSIAVFQDSHLTVSCVDQNYPFFLPFFLVAFIFRAVHGSNVSPMLPGAPLATAAAMAFLTALAKGNSGTQ